MLSSAGHSLFLKHPPCSFSVTLTGRPHFLTQEL